MGLPWGAAESISDRCSGVSTAAAPGAGAGTAVSLLCPAQAGFPSHPEASPRRWGTGEEGSGSAGPALLHLLGCAGMDATCIQSAPKNFHRWILCCILGDSALVTCQVYPLFLQPEPTVLGLLRTWHNLVSFLFALNHLAWQASGALQSSLGSCI